MVYELANRIAHRLGRRGTRGVSVRAMLTAARVMPFTPPEVGK